MEQVPQLLYQRVGHQAPGPPEAAQPCNPSWKEYLHGTAHTHTGGWAGPVTHPARLTLKLMGGKGGRRRRSSPLSSRKGIKQKAT